MSGSADILCVDDTADNLKLLSGILKDSGYRVRVASNGPQALAAARKEAPDLILLDVNMPQMDGYEVCRALKSDGALSDIPVIFLSALSETEDKVRAFQAGGVDYITKPFQYAEVCARVGTHLKLRALRTELQARIAELERADDLQESLVHMIVHDLRSPLTGIMTSLQMLEMSGKHENGEDLEDVVRGLESARSMSRMINALLDVARMESGELKLDARRTALADVVDDALRALGVVTRVHLIDIAEPGGPTFAHADRALLARVVENLVGNAVKFTPEGGRICIRMHPLDGRVRVEVSDTGIGVPPEYHAKIFEKFGQVEARAGRARSSTGLGLAFCKLVVQAHGGTIGVASEMAKGSTFWFELPAERTSQGERSAR